MHGSRLTWCLAVLGYVALISGCPSGEGEFKEYKAPKATVDDHGHDHEHAHGPHDGHIIELGEEEYHAELVYVPADAKVTIYTYGPDLDKPAAIDATEITLNLMIEGKAEQFALPAQKQEGDEEGKASKFELAGNETIKSKIKSEEDLHGKINVSIGGKSYVGEISHDHDHDHEHEHEGEAAEKKPEEKKAE